MQYTAPKQVRPILKKKLFLRSIYGIVASKDSINFQLKNYLRKKLEEEKMNLKDL